MERKEFLSQVGLGAAMVLGLGCLGSCSKSSPSPVPGAPTNVDFTIDLSSASSASLVVAGGYMYSGGIIIAHTVLGPYIAVSQACTHEGVTVSYDKTKKQFSCPSHDAKFSETGGVISGPTSSPLKQYSVVQTGNTLRIVG